MKKAACLTAWAIALGAWLPACSPPPSEAPEPEPQAPVEEPAAKAPPPPAQHPPVLHLFSPQGRHSFLAGETAEVTLVIGAATELPDVDVTLRLAGEDGPARESTDRLGSLAAGRHSVTYGIDVGCLPPGDYTLVAQAAGGQSEPYPLHIGDGVRRSHFRIIGWPQAPPADARDALRWRRVLGLNTVFLQGRSAWRESPADDDVGAAYDQVRSSPEAKPLELQHGPSPFARAGDLLTRQGIEWVNACAVSGGGVPLLGSEHDLSQQAVVRAALQRVHHRLLAERRFPGCAGLHFTTEATLGLADEAGGGQPFGHPARLAAFKDRLGLEDMPWRDGAKWEHWDAFLRYRASVLGNALATWAEGVRAIEPGYAATSQLAAPTSLSLGVYPPVAARGLGAITAQARLTGPAGMMWSAAAPDLLRMGNWQKPLWFMPLLRLGAEVDEVRAATGLALCRKVEGVVYPATLDYHFEQPAGGRLSTALVAGVGGVNERLLRFGDFLLALEKPRDDVAVFYSFTEHAHRIGQKPGDASHATQYPWRLITAYEALLSAHFTASFLTEEELLAGQATPSKAVLVVGLTRIRPEVQAALEAYAQGAGVVLTDPTTEVTLEGARKLDIEFPNLWDYHERLWSQGQEEKKDTTLERRDVVAQNTLIAPLLGKLRTELKALFDRDFTISDRMMVITDQRCGKGRYLFVANNRQREEVFRGLQWELAPSLATVTVREGDYCLYDVFGGTKVNAPHVKGHPTFRIYLPGGGLDCFAMLPEEVKGVRIRTARLTGRRLTVSAYVHGEEEEEPMDAAVPLEVSLRDPQGAERLRVYRAHTPGGYREEFPFAPLHRPGEWTVAVSTPLAQGEATAKLRVEASTPRWASRRGPLAVFDSARIRSFLRSRRPLWIVVGTAGEAEKAEPLAAALESAERPVAIKLAADLAKPPKRDEKAETPALSPAPEGAPLPNVPYDAILLGNVAAHPLLQAVDSYGLLPRSLTPDHPGPGGALLCWQVSAFEPGVETVVAAATDEPGVERAIQALLAAARAEAPRTAWRPLAPRGGPAPAEPQPLAPGVKVLEPAWTRRLGDNPTSGDAPLNGLFYSLGFLDGTLVTYDRIGKPQWDIRFSTRVRDVATTFQGIWTVGASFPEVAMLNPRGRVQWAAPPKENPPRSDFSAVAVAADGSWTVAGTLAGEVLGVGLGGQPLFGLGTDDADPDKEGWQPTFGPIADVAMAPQGDLAVVAAAKQTFAVDKTGQQLWAAEELEGVAHVAISYAEEPSIAVGSRLGFVARLEKGGKEVWRKPLDGYVASVGFLGAGQNVLAASLGGALACYGEDGEVLWQRDSPVGWRFVASSLDGEAIAAAELAGKVVLLRPTGDVFAETPPLEGAVCVLLLSADGRRLVVGTSAHRLYCFKHEPPSIERDEL
ncbi:MAG: PQQ-binding-like beta-propeller repeat protein [Candidatus Brocadiia bacterium]